MARLQSAMEFLMTYGWAILVIAVVLGALYELGLFSFNVSARLQPGSCSVSRPQGPGTTQNINTEGVCGGGIPEYVAVFNSNSYITINSSGSALMQDGITNFTVTAWFSAGRQPGVGGAILGDGSGAPTPVVELSISHSGYIISNICASVVISNYNAKSWYQVALEGVSNTITVYINGQLAGHGTCPLAMGIFGAPDEPFYIGSIGPSSGLPEYFNGSISNVQIYDTALSANAVQALYQEGIGGVPLDVYDLVGWWPLNGNANDYSGNMGNGASSNVVYTSSWTYDYATP